MNTIKSELDEAVAKFREYADECSDRYQVHADAYDATGDLAELAQGEYELGRASGYLAAANQLHQIRSMVLGSGVGDVPVKGQPIPKAVRT